MQEESTTVLDPDQMEQGKTRQAWEYTTKEERDEVEARLSKISPVARSPKVKEILHKIEQEKKTEDRTAALLHTLTERADTWGRKRLASVTRESSSEAGRLINAKVKLLHEADAAYSRLVDSAKDRVRWAVNQVQEQLNEELAKLAADKRAATGKIDSEFQPKLEEQEAKLKATNVDVTDTVGKFTSRIQGMPLYDLERIAEGKVVKITEALEGVEFPVEVICPDMIRETVEGP